MIKSRIKITINIKKTPDPGPARVKDAGIF